MPPFECFVAHYKDGLLKTEEVSKMLPGAKVEITERCSGHARMFGVKKDFHAMTMKIGKPVFKHMAEAQPDFISSDCTLGGHHIAQGIANQGGPVPQRAHPLTLLRRATASEGCIRYQVQEMLRFERTCESEGIQDELDSYNPLIPDGGNLKATRMIEPPDSVLRAERLQAMKGVGHAVYLEVEECPQVAATPSKLASPPT